MEAYIDHKYTLLLGDKGEFDNVMKTGEFLDRLEDRKKWQNSKALRIRTSGYNLRLVIEIYGAVTTTDKRELKLDLPRTSSKMVWKTEPYKFQQAAFDQLKNMSNAALFLEQGTGKTKICLDMLQHSYLSGWIDCAVVISWPKGVHNQWVEEQIPTHWPDSHPYQACAWDGKRIPEYHSSQGMLFICANVEALNSKTFRQELDNFLVGRTYAMVIDESQRIKNSKGVTHEQACRYGLNAERRILMTGTPIGKSLQDEWAQFLFLDPDIIGCNYLTSFRNEFCRMGGFEGRVIIGHQNVERFHALTAPYIYRVTKEEVLDLPPKVYDKVTYAMTPEQLKHQQDLKKNFLTYIAGLKVMTVKNAAVLVTRLQQLACGYLVEDPTDPLAGLIPTIHKIKHDRIKVLQDILDQRTGKAVIWCRFVEDIKTIEEHLKDQCVSYYGATKDADREHNKRRFLNDIECRYFVGNPASAGAGLNLQGPEVRTSIYYSQSFNSIERWQSEDRIHRIGTSDTVTYFDIVARGSVDSRVLLNLKAKKDLADLVLDDIREMINGL